MTTIKYELCFDKYLCVSIDSDGQNDKFRLQFDKEYIGSVRFGNQICRIDGDSCLFNTGSLKDGIYEGTLYTGGDVFSLEPIEINNFTPKRIKFGDGEIRELYFLFDKILKRTENLEKLSSELINEIRGSSIL